MPNYGERIVYWYLRLNGFFLLENFVIHRTVGSSDVDVIGVRFPHVFEEVGGHPDDWDQTLFDFFEPNIPIGLITEVKTGVNYDVQDVFQAQNISYSVGRFGFVKDPRTLEDPVSKNARFVELNQFQIGKILFSDKDLKKSDRFFHISLSHARKFLENRMRKYPDEKFRDRLRFNSELIQDLIHMTHNNRFSERYEST